MAGWKKKEVITRSPKRPDTRLKGARAKLAEMDIWGIYAHLLTPKPKIKWTPNLMKMDFNFDHQVPKNFCSCSYTSRMLGTGFYVGMYLFSLKRTNPNPINNNNNKKKCSLGQFQVLMIKGYCILPEYKIPFTNPT